MKPYDMVSSFRGANTLLQGQQNKNRADHRRQINRQINEQIQGETNTDQRRPDQRRSKDKSRGTRTAPRHNVRGSEYIVKQRL
jgi:hypothetical protein